jgi:catechol 2,3-dioxygenase-like lactoylglutathione lyase family enzyme
MAKRVRLGGEGYRGRVFDHVAIRVSDRPRSEGLYVAVLDVLDIRPTLRDGQLVAWEDLVMLAADGEHPPTRHLHVGFVSPSREAVREFWRVGLEAGASSDGEPGERPRYTSGYYGAFLLDLDGNSIEAVIHDDVRRGGNVDHLWIGVRDVAASVAFYRSIARYTGLRDGRSWDAGRQFRGAWATFSLVADGRPVTENLHLAFPAPDRRTVDEFHRAATAAGYRDAGAAGERDGGGYGARVLDPDGTIVESIARGSR